MIFIHHYDDEWHGFERYAKIYRERNALSIVHERGNEKAHERFKREIGQYEIIISSLLYPDKIQKDRSAPAELVQELNVICEDGNRKRPPVILFMKERHIREGDTRIKEAVRAGVAAEDVVSLETELAARILHCMKSSRANSD